MTTVEARAVVVGGGPAGLMAAETLARGGAAVTVYELHRSPGRKLLLAGRSGLNLTHAVPFEQVRDRDDPLPEALVAALDAFPASAVREWADELGAATFVGSSGRVFPTAMRAAPLLRAWLRRLDELGVELRTRHELIAVDRDGLRFRHGQTEVADRGDAVVLAMGGASWPRVSSPGRWVDVVEEIGVGVEPLRPANCGAHVAWSSVMRERHEGAPVKNVVVSFGDRSVRGELTITATGLEGTPVYSLASTIGATAQFPATVNLDLHPDLDIDAVAERLRRRRKKESQSSWLRHCGLSPVAIGILRESSANELPDDPMAMAALVKAAPLAVTGLAGIDRAISSAGGVRFDELDEWLMLRARPGMFAAGEMLDWDAPTGGYLLQGCFSTGHRAGLGALHHLGLSSD